MDPIAPIVIHQPDILPVARAVGIAHVSPDGRGRGDGAQPDGSGRAPDDGPDGDDQTPQDELRAGAQTPHLLDVVADDLAAETDPPQLSSGGHVDLTA